jgi:hypothetical protein
MNNPIITMMVIKVVFDIHNHGFSKKFKDFILACNQSVLMIIKNNNKP